MGVLSRKLRSAILPTTLYALLVSVTAWHHEPWADEAQAWLLARDEPFVTLWTCLLHYEGTPGLWHSALWLLSHLHLPYQSLTFFSAALGTAAAWLVFRFAPFAAPLRLLLPFTYFFAYQYSVVARSYSLIPPLLFGLASCYPQRTRRPLLYAALLGALALTSMHGLVLSFLIAATTFRHRALLLYAACAALAVFSAWPARDVSFVRHYNYSLEHLAITAARVIAEAFTTEWISALLLIASSLPFLFRGGTLPFFVLSAATLVSLAAVIYGQVWHFGLLFLAWIFALWLAALRTRPGWLATAALSLALAIHCLWTASASHRDITTAYSGGFAAARYLAQNAIPAQGLYGVGYACVAVQPYFAHNIFRNFGHSYWDWSSRNRMIADYPNLPESRPPWVLVGYKTAEENYLWNSQVRRAGYTKIKHFEGNLIWEDEEFEPESFDLYRRQ